MHYDIHEDAMRVEKNYASLKRSILDTAFVLGLVTLVPALIAAVL